MMALAPVPELVQQKSEANIRALLHYEDTLWCKFATGLFLDDDRAQYWSEYCEPPHWEWGDIMGPGDPVGEAAEAAALAAYMLASSWALTMFFLYLILLLPNQLLTWDTEIPHCLASSSLASSLG